VAAGRVLGGVSGGATLGLALLAAGAPIRAAVLHEPAAGSLVPGLLDAVAEAHRTGGVSGFARALYGNSWSRAVAPLDDEAVARDLSMFRAFEPRAAADVAVPVVLTVGARSPAIRHEVARVLGDRFGYEIRVLDGCGHAAHLEAPDEFAALLAEAAQ
ncbi:MAG: hypothetical protein JWM93_3194, partial [Frankiales bacterium]|nr:hypothetical protein [Frankiales bacterium]